MPLCLPQIAHRLPWVWAWGCAVISQWLYTWDTAWPFGHILHFIICSGLDIIFFLSHFRHGQKRSEQRIYVWNAVYFMYTVVIWRFFWLYQDWRWISCGWISLHQGNHPDVEAARTFETSLKFYQTTCCNNPEDSHLHTCYHENLKSHNVKNDSC
jgi:hypothetical protein